LGGWKTGETHGKTMGNPVVMEIPWEYGNLLFEAIRMVMV